MAIFSIKKDQLPLHLAGLASALAYVWLSVSSQQEGSASLWDLWAVALFCALLCMAIWRFYNSERTLSISAILLWALLFRLIGTTAFPVMEDDFYRYLWDGRTLLENGSPYTRAPADFFAQEGLSDAEEELLNGINHPEVKTVYGPLNHYLFALSHLISPGKIWPLQLMLALLDMGLIVLLLRLAPIRSVLLYAWCPLAVKEFAFTAHPDIIALLPMVAALVSTKKQQWKYTALWLALAVSAKIFALILVPLLLRFQWRSWLIFGATLAAVWVPVSGGQLPGGLSAMAADWQFNAPLYQLFGVQAGPARLKLILLGLFCSFWAIYAWQHLKTPENHLPRGDWLFAALLICSPVLNPWYFIWILPFAVIWPSRWAWMASIAVLLAYASGINLPDSNLGLYQQPSWAMITQFGLIAIALGWDTLMGKKIPPHRQG
ncbi:MAG: hypothetical protein OIF34_01920 [Porticoccaceae bacterium]|nr:hypothetical protein [Porticoccaceae bacterium]